MRFLCGCFLFPFRYDFTGFCWSSVRIFWVIKSQLETDTLEYESGPAKGNNCPVNLHTLFYLIRSAWYFFRVWNFKKNVQNMVWKKQGAKNRVNVIQKENKQPGLFSFWITMTQFFAPCFFQVHILDLIFFRVANRPMFSKQE